MPALGRAVGAGVTSIYWYFRNKDDLLVALAEQVTADMYLRWTGLGDGPWDEELRRSFIAFRDELTASRSISSSSRCDHASSCPGPASFRPSCAAWRLTSASWSRSV